MQKEEIYISKSLFKLDYKKTGRRNLKNETKFIFVFCFVFFYSLIFYN